jgi:hypothetical protein
MNQEAPMELKQFGACLAVLLVSSCADEPLPLDPGPLVDLPVFSLIGYEDPWLSEEEAAGLQGILNIELARLEFLMVGTASPGPSFLEVETEATAYVFSPAGPLFPRIRHDANLSVVIDGELQGGTQGFPTQYQLTTGWRMNVYQFNTPLCSEVTSLTANASSSHWAKWNYFLIDLSPPFVGQLMEINKGPLNRTASANCLPNGPTPGGGGGIQELEGECQFCQQWFWVEGGEVLDEWWECEPIEWSFCEEEAY